MRKKYMYILVVLAAASCARAGVAGLNESEITFDADVYRGPTKAGDATPAISEFGLYAYANTDITAATAAETTYQNLQWMHFNNEKIVYDDTKSYWKGARSLCWPTGTKSGLDMFCYAPYAATPWCAIDSSNGHLTATVATDPTEDNLYTNPMLKLSAASGQIPVSFKHALSKLSIGVKVNRFDDSMDLVNGWEPSETGTPAYVITNEIKPGATSASAIKLKEPIQNIWYVKVNSVSISNYSASGTLDAGTKLGVYQIDKGWSVAAHTDTKVIMDKSLQDGTSTSPNQYGIEVPFGEMYMVPQIFNQGATTPVKTRLSLNVTVTSYMDNGNKNNDGNAVFDYRDIYQFTTGEGGKINWTLDANGRPSLRSSGLTPYLSQTLTTEAVLSKHDINSISAGTELHIVFTIDPAGDEIMFAPTQSEWINTNAQSF